MADRGHRRCTTSKAAGRDRITITESTDEAPSLAAIVDPSAAPQNGHGNGNGSRAKRRKPAIHDAAREDDPEPRGLEIR